MRKYGDVRIAKAFCVKGVEHAEATRFSVIAPVMAFSIREVFLQPGKHSGQRAGMQNVLAAQQVGAKRPGGQQRLPHFEKWLDRLQHHAATAGP